jgi:lipoprotein-anchoring transpeptidase ErfK/SrfK
VYFILKAFKSFRHKILSTLIFFLIFLLSFLYIKSYFFGNTFIDDIDISNHHFYAVRQNIQEFGKRRIQILINDRIYSYSPADIGIFFDENKFYSFASFKNQPPQALFLEYLQSIIFKKTTVLSSPILFSEHFYNYFSSREFDFSEDNPGIQFNQDEKLATFIPQKIFKIDPLALKKEIQKSIFAGDDEVIASTILKSDVLGVKAESINLQINMAYEAPMTVIVPDNIGPDIFVSVSDLKKISSLDHEFGSSDFKFGINDENFDNFFIEKTADFNLHEDMMLSTDQIKTQILSLLNQRAAGIKADIIIAEIKSKPNTDGLRAQKYIEVDISQQRMYLFFFGKIHKEYLVSTGLYYPTPVGEFKILNKAKNAYSDIYNVYMPYWMAFHYGREVQAYFGIHELPYFISRDGKRHQRPREFIGSPRTGGCVALDINEAQEVYNFSDINMPVLIFN